MKHEEHDELSPLLQEWHAPEPWPGIDARMLAKFRNRPQPQSADWWTRIWAARITIPVPVLASVLLLLLAAAVLLRSPAARHPAPPPAALDGYVTRVEAAGFQPVRDAPVHIIRGKETN